METCGHREMTFDIMKGSVLVIGGGIAGMRAAVELLLQGFKVYLLEEGPRFGGNMATIDRLFPQTNMPHAPCSLSSLNSPAIQTR